MCHHFRSIDDLTAEERKAVREEHSSEELRAEYPADELEKLGVTV
jgi:hypothetical protein